MRGYYDFAHDTRPPPSGARVGVPAGFAVFADSYRADALRTPRELADGLLRDRPLDHAGGGISPPSRRPNCSRTSFANSSARSAEPPGSASMFRSWLPGVGGEELTGPARRRPAPTRISRGPLSPTASPAPAPMSVWRWSQAIPSVRKRPQIVSASSELPTTTRWDRVHHPANVAERLVNLGGRRIDADEILVLRVTTDVGVGEWAMRHGVQTAGADVVEGAADEAPAEPAALERRVDIRVDEDDRPRLDAAAQYAGEGSVHLELVAELRRVVHDANAVVARPRRLHPARPPLRRARPAGRTPRTSPAR